MTRMVWPTVTAARFAPRRVVGGRRYAAARQLAAVDGERVLLNVGRDYLAKH